MQIGTSEIISTSLLTGIIILSIQRREYLLYCVPRADEQLVDHIKWNANHGHNAKANACDLRPQRVRVVVAIRRLLEFRAVPQEHNLQAMTRNTFKSKYTKCLV